MTKPRAEKYSKQFKRRALEEPVKVSRQVERAALRRSAFAFISKDSKLSRRVRRFLARNMAAERYQKTHDLPTNYRGVYGSI